MPCLITPKLDSLLDEDIGIGGLGGVFPVWSTAVGESLWSDVPTPYPYVLAPPYQGGLKTAWVVDKRVPDGIFRVTGSQLGSDREVLFSVGDVKPSRLLEVASAHEGPTGSPPGFQYHIAAVYYPDLAVTN